MGAGCYYTHDNISKKSFWIDFKLPDTTNSDLIDEFYQDELYLIREAAYSLNYHDTKDPYHFHNGLYELRLKYTYDGSGIVFNLEPHDDEEQNLTNLAIANHDIHYNRLAKKLNEYGFNLRIATSGYTSTEYTVN